MVPRLTGQIMRASGLRFATSRPRWFRQGSERQIVQLVRGKDEHGNFEIVAPPRDAATAAEIRKDADRRITKNVMPELSRIRMALIPLS